MAQFASDAFGGTAGTELATYNANWTRHTSYSVNCVISDAGRLRRDASTSNSSYYHANTPASADYDVSMNVTHVSNSGAGAGPAGRINTAANTMYTARSQTGSWLIHKIVAGSVTPLGTLAQSAGHTLNVGETRKLTLRMVGDQISLLVDDVLRVGPITDTDISAAGRAGFRLTSGSSGDSDTVGLHLDNFSADQSAGPSGSNITRGVKGMTGGMQNLSGGTQ